MSYQLHLGDCLAVMQGMEPNSIDAIVTDPPYGLFFMGRDWDHGVPGVPFWEAALRVAKPGAHLLAFGSPRTHHRLMVAIEDAGWELRDCLMFLHGQGFPKSHDISKAIDKAAGAEREVIGPRVYSDGSVAHRGKNDYGIYAQDSWSQNPDNWRTLDTAPATDAAKQWSGFGTNLKPSFEPIILARKPLSEPNIAANVLRWGTGGLNVDGCRIGANPGYKYNADRNGTIFHGDQGERTKRTAEKNGAPLIESTQGRWPANLVLDEDAAALLDAQSGERKSGTHIRSKGKSVNCYGQYSESFYQGLDTTGGASRFFYCAKASKRDRDEGLEGMPKQFMATMGDGIGAREHNPEQPTAWVRNHHPTVKPTDLMRWLVRLVTPPNGTVLDCFCGSGSTGKAAMLEGFRFVGIDTEQEYLHIADKRIAHALAQYEMGQELAALQPRLLETS